MCGRPLCLSCAIPVRGQVLGAECLAAVLGPDGPPEEPAAPARPRQPGLTLAGAGFALAVAASLLPWTRFGQGSGLFGAWGISPFRWSSLAALAGALGLALWVGARLTSRIPERTLARLLSAMAALAGLGSLLHLLHPPPFTHPWLGPWVALAAATAALAGSLLIASRVASPARVRA